MGSINIKKVLAPALLSFIMMLALAPPNAWAGINHWTTNGFYGGEISSLVYSPNYASDHTLFAGTFYGGVFISTDSGTSWSAANKGLTNPDVFSLAVSPNYATDHTIIVGTWDGGVFISTDSGGNWSAANTGLDGTDQPIYSVAVSPDYSSDHTLFAGTFDGVYISSNSGGNWSAANVGMPAVLDIHSLEFSPNYSSDHTLFAGTNDGVFISSNSGGNWSAANTGLSSTIVTSLVVSPNYSTDHTLFAGVFDSGVFISTDSASTWSAANAGIPAYTWSESLAISPNYALDHTIILGSSADGVFVSADSGASWSAANAGLTDTGVRALAVSPLYLTDHTLFAGTSGGGGIFKSTDGGGSWSKANTGLTNTNAGSMAVSSNYANDHTIFAGTQYNGIFVSTDSGASWSTANVGLANTDVTSLAVSPFYSSDHTLFAGTFGGIFKSTDGGDSWGTANWFLNNTNVDALAISPNYNTDHTIFAGYWDYDRFTSGGVGVSTDSGSSWSGTSTVQPFIEVDCLAISPDFANDHTLFAGTHYSGLLVSSNSGESWRIVNVGAQTLAISPNYGSDHTLFAGSDGRGVSVSTDSGKTWGAVNTGLTSLHVVSVAISPNYDTDHTIIAGTSDQGVFISNNSGASWSDISTGLNVNMVLSLAISPSFGNDHTIFAGTQGGGVFSYTIDDIPPVVSEVAPTGIITGSSATISANYADSGSGIDTASVTVNLNGNTLGNCTATAASVSCPETGLGPGTYFISGQVKDNAGNSASISGSFALASATPKNYFWSWYDNSGGDNWVLMANPASASADEYLSLRVGAGFSDLAAYNNGTVSPGSSIEPYLSGKVGGPVEASSLTGDPAITSQRTLWPKVGSSLEEVPGIDEADLSSDYWWTWYDQTQGRLDWVMAANPSASTSVYYQIDIARGCEASPQTSCATGKLSTLGDSQGGDKAQKQFDGLIAGPVEVKGCDQAFATNGSCPGAGENLIASQRVLTDGNAFNELPGTPASKLSDDYLWTWYDSDTGYVVNGSIAGGYDWVMIANPDASQDVYYQVSIAGGCAQSNAALCQYGSVPAGGWTAPTFTNTMSGPVELKGCSQPLAGDGTCPGTPKNLIASQRSLIGPSFEEVPGYPRSNLASSYDWTWYDEANPNVSLNWVMIANPGAAPVSATVSFKDQTGTPVTATQTIAPGANWNPAFPGKIGGPVSVTSTGGPVLASQRVLWKGYFNEVLGQP